MAIAPATVIQLTETSRTQGDGFQTSNSVESEKKSAYTGPISTGYGQRRTHNRNISPGKISRTKESRMTSECDRCSEKSSNIVNISHLPELAAVAHLGYRMVCAP